MKDRDELNRCHRRRAKRPALLLLVGFALSLWTCAAVADAQPGKLVIKDSEGQALITLPMPSGSGWCMAWNHSVKGFEILDCYRNVAGQMVLERSHLPDFAAGLDHIFERGRQLSDGHGGYWIEDIDEPVPGNHYRLRAGSMKVDHRLVNRDRGRLETSIRQAREDCTDALPESVPEAVTPISISALAANQRVSVNLEDCEEETSTQCICPQQ